MPDPASRRTSPQKNMKQYLSFGGGVNSTALLLLLTDRGEDFETIFVNHGGDYPETYKYVDYIRGHGFEITEVVPNCRGYNTLYEYCIGHKIIPTVHFRWCTIEFKVKPYLDYIKPNIPCVSFIGFDAGESRRVERSKTRKPRYAIERKIKNEFPLFDSGMDRAACIDLIKKHRLDIPPKSGCYFCPFQKNIEYRRLFLEYKDLYRKVEELERNRVAKNEIYLRGGKPISDIAMSHTEPLTSYFNEEA